MRSLKTLALAGAVFAGATAVASAADLRYPQPVGLPPPPLAAPIAEASGWYLRGDIGIGALDSGRPAYSDNPAGLIFHGPQYGAQVFGGVGIGYQFNSWLRFDVTAEYRSGAGGRGFVFNDSYRLDDGITTFSGTNRITGRFTATVLMANAYIDLGTWHGITPFVGAGVGYASKTLGSIKDNGYATAVTNATGIITNNSFVQGSAGNKTTTGMAWALMAGFAVDVTQNVKAEFGYRYLNLGKIETGIFNCGGCNYTLRAKDVESHELKVGLRYMFGGPSYAAAPYPVEPPRLVKKF
jgi:opacity protein-like surface antigen